MHVYELHRQGAQHDKNNNIAGLKLHGMLSQIMSLTNSSDHIRESNVR